MVSSRAKTPSGAAEAIPMPTEMDSRVVENEKRDGAMAGKVVETERRDGDDGGQSGGDRKKDGGDDRRHDGRNGQSGGDSEPSGEGLKKGSACKHCLSGWGKSTCP